MYEYTYVCIYIYIYMRLCVYVFLAIWSSSCGLDCHGGSKMLGSHRRHEGEVAARGTASNSWCFCWPALDPLLPLLLQHSMLAPCLVYSILQTALVTMVLFGKTKGCIYTTVDHNVGHRPQQTTNGETIIVATQR